MHHEEIFDQPGGDDFVDVKYVFEDAARDMQPDELIFTEGFNIQDAMSAIEIGEPRMDSGMIPEAAERPEFQPLALLLPEEVCWVMDRILACEIEWHTGNALSQTVFTVLYVHHLNDIDPDYIMDTDGITRDPSRPLELITVVIRSAVMGMLKCCDLVWRELSKNRVHEGEDWQGEKCEISLLEGYPIRGIIKAIEQAGHWVRTATTVSATLRNELLSRLLFRKTMIELITLHLPEDHDKLQAHLTTAQGLLKGFKSRPVPAPPPHSPAHLVFDPYVTRRLHSFIPLRPIQLPAQEKAWEGIEAALDGWQELYYLSTVTSVTTWKMVGQTRVWSSQASRTNPFLRSLTQSFFFDGSRFIGRYEDNWIIERFCEETIGVKLEDINLIIQNSWKDEAKPPIGYLHRLMIKVMMPYIRSFWHNPPRQRRFLSKSLLDWHVLYASTQDLLQSCHTEDESEARILDGLPKALLLWRLEIIQEVVLSGFQLDLYNPDEASMVYWYACQVMMARLECLDALLGATPPDSMTSDELRFQRSFVTALHDMCLATALLAKKPPIFSPERSFLNFERRCKWAFREEYSQVPVEPVAQPNFEDYMTWRDAETSTPPDRLLESASAVLLELSESDCAGRAGFWWKDRLKCVSKLASLCTQMADKIRSADGPLNFQYAKNVSPWFPVLC
ncbi:Mak10-domain-containing protein [Neolentinus lepideus HHB14362 ss-1]|uniref:Mak10-domain-containing protein n=1 Tax=Neolentinus lepideus HHB14362 ss-1 TaxID=1314782 RepID=A0A165MVC2_9AGAM|nr:Mak10-domain-containing protein [Neolentinus lepideus HHB14362 ss-1]